MDDDGAFDPDMMLSMQDKAGPVINACLDVRK